MAKSLPACVTDANIWIDLHVGHLSSIAVSLPFRWHAPDVALAELQFGPTSESVVSLGVRSVALTGEQLAQVGHLAGIYRGVSAADLAALVLARALGATLLTGDRHLRAAAENEAVGVHGTLWLLDQLLDRNIVSTSDLADALDRMIAAGRRLPHGEVQYRLRMWRASGSPPLP